MAINDAGYLAIGRPIDRVDIGLHGTTCRLYPADQALADGVQRGNRRHFFTDGRTVFGGGRASNSAANAARWATKALAGTRRGTRRTASSPPWIYKSSVRCTVLRAAHDNSAIWAWLIPWALSHRISIRSCTKRVGCLNRSRCISSNTSSGKSKCRIHALRIGELNCGSASMRTHSARYSPKDCL